ncbi:hypothetical protein AXG93_4201s1470 [Marchantia polymorpha subsp. ruderalis]|uniref:Uncharacterized protein n=1 Tax=Marchantia polymorpha subsp. ruderalis TaxID=1480154 RepID=A0A176WDY7_MARPO|nr:hypothetical protein AXG93_4201s1470 [Marchantia polymorpha subsp. ruderalis]
MRSLRRGGIEVQVSELPYPLLQLTHLEIALAVTPCTKPPDPSAASQNEAASDDIRRMLRDDELRKLIQKIDSSITPEKDLDKAMEGAAFKQFTDKILAVVSSEDKSHVTQS